MNITEIVTGRIKMGIFKQNYNLAPWIKWIVQLKQQLLCIHTNRSNNE